VIYIVCALCKVGLRISPGEEGESEGLFGKQSDYYPNSYPCFKCEQPIAQFIPAMSSDSVTQLELFDVTPKEAFAAMNGLGLPGEQDCSAAAVKDLFEMCQVKRVQARPIRNSHRCLIDFIELADGTKVYLGSSAMGATVYRVAKPHSYAEQV
jgi:hypothetical protein